MISLNFYFWLLILLLVYLYGEIFLSMIIHSIFKNLKLFNQQNLKNNTILFKNLYLNTSFTLLLLLFISFKIQISNVFISFFIIFLIINKYINSYIQNYLNFLNFNILMFFIIFFFIKNYVILYIIVELYAILFYFFFLNINFNFKQLYLIQYKNSLLLYLFNNFLTSILFLFGINSIISCYGSINFIELNFFSLIKPNWHLYFIIVAFIFKLSLPGYHFLKIELYKYLSISNVILFSVITLYINYLFTFFIFNQNLIFFLLNYYKIFNLILFLSLFFFIQKLKISNFQEFIAYSGFATNNLIVVNFLI